MAMSTRYFVATTKYIGRMTTRTGVIYWRWDRRRGVWVFMDDREGRSSEYTLPELLDPKALPEGVIAEVSGIPPLGWRAGDPIPYEGAWRMVALNPRRKS